MNHFSIITADATFKAFDSGPETITGIILIKNVIKTEGDSLRDFISDDIIFGKNALTITPPAATDLGKGDGVAITNARFLGGNDLNGVFEFIPPGKYNIAFPYWFKA